MQAFNRAGIPPVTIDNTRAIGQVLYTQYFYLFQVAGLVLLVAMIGAIVLTLRSRPGRAPPAGQRSALPAEGRDHDRGQGPVAGGRVMGSVSDTT